MLSNISECLQSIDKVKSKSHKKNFKYASLNISYNTKLICKHSGEIKLLCVKVTSGN
jgi:hypothetical protein